MVGGDWKIKSQRKLYNIIPYSLMAISSILIFIRSLELSGIIFGVSIIGLYRAIKPIKNSNANDKKVEHIENKKSKILICISYSIICIFLFLSYFNKSGDDTFHVLSTILAVLGTSSIILEQFFKKDIE